jgi:hypothetical protein
MDADDQTEVYFCDNLINRAVWLCLMSLICS